MLTATLFYFRSFLKLSIFIHCTYLDALICLASITFLSSHLLPMLHTDDCRNGTKPALGMAWAEYEPV